VKPDTACIIRFIKSFLAVMTCYATFDATVERSG
jgi:hypothetical protein